MYFVIHRKKKLLFSWDFFVLLFLFQLLHFLQIPYFILQLNIFICKHCPSFIIICVVHLQWCMWHVPARIQNGRPSIAKIPTTWLPNPDFFHFEWWVGWIIWTGHFCEDSLTNPEPICFTNITHKIEWTMVFLLLLLGLRCY